MRGSGSSDSSCNVCQGFRIVRGAIPKVSNKSLHEHQCVFLHIPHNNE